MPVSRRILSRRSRSAGERFASTLALAVAGSGARQQLRDTRHFADENLVPSFQDLSVREFDAEQLAKGGKEFSVADLALLVPLIKFVAPGKPSPQLRDLATGVTGPAGDHLAEIDIEHHAAEVEQQRIGSAGEERGLGHRGGLRTSRKESNRSGMLRSLTPVPSIPIRLDMQQR